MFLQWAVGGRLREVHLFMVAWLLRNLFQQRFAGLEVVVAWVPTGFHKKPLPISMPCKLAYPIGFEILVQPHFGSWALILSRPINTSTRWVKNHLALYTWKLNTFFSLFLDLKKSKYIFKYSWIVRMFSYFILGTNETIQILLGLNIFTLSS